MRFSRFPSVVICSLLMWNNGRQWHRPSCTSSINKSIILVIIRSFIMKTMLYSIKQTFQATGIYGEYRKQTIWIKRVCYRYTYNVTSFTFITIITLKVLIQITKVCLSTVALKFKLVDTTFRCSLMSKNSNCVNIGSQPNWCVEHIQQLSLLLKLPHVIRVNWTQQLSPPFKSFVIT